MTTLYPIQQPLDIPSTSGIYKITCLTTSKFYIGSAVNLRSRWSKHQSGLQRNTHSNQKLQNAWNKYGKNDFTFEVIELVLVPFLITQEQYWMDKLQPNFNLAPNAGSSLGVKSSPETRERIRQANLGKPADPESIEKMRQANLGKPGHNLGKKMNDASKEKMRKAQTGRTHSAETKEKMSNTALGHTVSPESRAKMSASRKGKPSPLRGKKASPEACANIKAGHESQKKTLIVTDPNGIEYTITGIRQFCKTHNLHRANLIQVAKGNQDNHKGWKARYL